MVGGTSEVAFSPTDWTPYFLGKLSDKEASKVYVGPPSPSQTAIETWVCIIPVCYLHGGDSGG